MTDVAGSSVAVSVVSYRTPELLEQCLDALQSERERSRSEVPMEVTVVDNASADGSADMVSQRFPWVRLIRNAANLGFGAAHNQALLGCQATYAVVLNSDAVVSPGAIGRMVGYLDNHPDVGVAGPRLRYPDGRTQPSRRRFPTPAVFFLESTQLQRFWPRNACLRRFFMEDQSEWQTQDVEWLVGACLCVRSSAMAEVGLFDERFFLYSEEVDWCRRFRAAGWRVVYLPEAEVMHLEGASSGTDLLARDRRFHGSKIAYMHKWHGPRLAAAMRAYLVLEYLFRGAEEGAKLVAGSRVAERRARLRVIGGYLRSALRGE